LLCKGIELQFVLQQEQRRTP